MTALKRAFDPSHWKREGKEVDLVVKTKVNSRIGNQALAQVFQRMAACYRYLGPEERFRALAYQKAAHTIDSLKEGVSDYVSDLRALKELPGIGESIAEKIVEYCRSGKIRLYEKLKRQVPEGLLELMDIRGFGPATVRALYEKLGIRNGQQLTEAITSGRLSELKGFGPAKLEQLTRGLKLYKMSASRMLLSQAQERGNEILMMVSEIKGVVRAELAGSLRRRKETVGDIDLIICAAQKSRASIISKILRSGLVGSVLAKGNTRVSFLTKHTATQVDMRLVSEEEYGAALLYFTGSKEHNLELRARAKSKGWKLNEYGLFNLRTGKRIAGSSEAAMYAAFGLDYIPPELRENRGELEKAEAHRLPKLVEPAAIKGDCQMHSRWSDGEADISTIARYVRSHFPQYEYIVITDHSPRSRIARGLQPSAFRKQFAEIDSVNKKLGFSFVKKGVEVDILEDGSLDLPDELLEQFDWVTASIHSGFRSDNTERLIRAAKHPAVCCLGHPSGRLLGRREAYPVDWSRLFAVLVKTGTSVEINAQPERLDLNDELTSEALRAGVRMTISTDAHALGQFEFMDFGVSVARRAGCTKEDILNTRSWQEMTRLLKKTAAGRIRKSRLESRDYAYITKN